MKKPLNANMMKFLAICAMTLDHIAWVFFPGYPREVLPLVMHIIGRITCPVMCYCISEGFYHTRNIRKYTARLFVFALISHFAYVFFSAGFAGWKSFLPFHDGSLLNQTSVMWPLAWGLVMLRVVSSQSLKPRTQTLLVLLICLLSFPADWSCIASLFVLAFGTNRGNFKAQMLWMVFYAALYSLVYFVFLDPLYGLVQMAVVLAIPVLKLYNGQRGRSPGMNRLMKWLFYLYYPLHLWVLGCLQLLS